MNLTFFVVTRGDRFFFQCSVFYYAFHARFAQTDTFGANIFFCFYWKLIEIDHRKAASIHIKWRKQSKTSLHLPISKKQNILIPDCQLFLNGASSSNFHRSAFRSNCRQLSNAIDSFKVLQTRYIYYAISSALCTNNNNNTSSQITIHIYVMSSECVFFFNWCCLEDNVKGN